MESTSSENPSAVRRLRQLMREASVRRDLGLSVAEGPRLAREALDAGALRTLWATPEALPSLDAAGVLAEAGRTGVQVRSLASGLLEKISDTRSPQGCLCEVETKGRPIPPTADLFLALDTLQDPGNLGTLLRCAWACGAVVLLNAACADPWSPKVLRAGAGAQFHVPMLEASDFGAALGELSARGVRIYGTAPRATSNYLEADCGGGICWMLGSEGQGLGSAMQARCDRTFRIAYPGGAESLNVAVSGAILLFETIRQRAEKSLIALGF